MARKKKNNVSSLKLLIVVCIINIALYAMFSLLNIEDYVGLPSEEQDALVNIYEESDLTIHYIDVGQGDAILISKSGKNMLIDAGPTSARENVVNYLKSAKVNSLEYVIVTHPHEDHIGGMANVIRNFKINNLFVSKYTSTSKTYENFILAAKEKGLSFYAPNVGDSFQLADANFTVLSGGELDTENANDRSIVIRLEYKNNSFLFMGDAEEALELKVISGNLEYKSDVLKVAHHGSNTSTTSTFLKAIEPDYAIISCGVNNNYGHPCKSVMRRLKNSEIKVYRTDENSTIVLKSDGENITFNTLPGSYSFISAN